MLHAVLIGLHAASGVVCFVAGVLACGQVRAGFRYRIYLGFLIALVVFMVAAIIVDWADLGNGARGTYLGLTALGLFMVWHGGRAGRLLRRRPTGWRSRYLDHIGFTLISLFDGFVIVTAIDIGAPVWQVVVIAVAGITAGVLVLRHAKTRLTGAAPTSGNTRSHLQ